MSWLDLKEHTKPKTSGFCDSGILKGPFPFCPQLAHLPGPSAPPLQALQLSTHPLRAPVGPERPDWALGGRLLLNALLAWNDLAPDAKSQFRSWLRQVRTSWVTLGKARPLSMSQFSFLICELGVVIAPISQSYCEGQRRRHWKLWTNKQMFCPHSPTSFRASLTLPENCPWPPRPHHL